MADFPEGRYGPSRRKSFDSTSCLPIAIFVLIILGVIGSILYGIAQVNTHGSAQHCLVSEKDRAKNNDGKSDARIYTENCGVFQVKDTLLGKTNFNSADLYASIKVGDTYDFETRGFRFGLFSDFPIILTATKVD